MKNIRRYEHTFIIFSALIIALLNTLPYMSSILYASDNPQKPWLSSSYIMTRSVWYIAQSFVTVMVLLHYNYFWTAGLIPKKTKKFLKAMLILMGNIILAVGILYLTVYFAEYTIGNPFGIKGAFYFYAWKYVYILPLSILIAWVLNMISKSRIMEIENLKLREENLKVQIKSLQEQVNPHFLFNNLNTLSSIIRLGKREDGLQYVDDLAKVYRYVIENESNELVPLEEELKVLDSYYFMLRKRYGMHFSLEISISERTKDSLIPPLVLQHLVENAIKHNEISKQKKLTIHIKDDEEHIIVKNNIHSKSKNSYGLGIGLPNLIKQYQLLTGQDVSIFHHDNEFIIKLPIIKS